MGVDPFGLCINVEQFAYNSKNYSSRPDQSGYVAEKELITEELSHD